MEDALHLQYICLGVFSVCFNYEFLHVPFQVVKDVFPFFIKPARGHVGNYVSLFFSTYSAEEFATQ